MGNCDFKKEAAPATIPSIHIFLTLGTSKANFQSHYVIGRGGYGKVRRK